jgi:hypothetical protein
MKQWGGKVTTLKAYLKKNEFRISDLRSHLKNLEVKVEKYKKKTIENRKRKK